MNVLTGTFDPEWGHTFLASSNGLVYALRSLPGQSALLVFDSSLRPVCEQATPGEHTCHITLLDGQAVCCDYTSGTMSVFPLSSEGLPGKPRIVRFEGHGPNEQRQAGPHIHSSWVSPDGKDLVVVDLGGDCLYRFGISDGKIYPDYNAAGGGAESFPMPAGCGPRHCAFSPDGRFLYVITELSAEVLVLEYPSMNLIQRAQAGGGTPMGGGHVILSKDGNTLYASTRLKDDGISIFGRDPDSGLLVKKTHFLTGAHPRHFCLTPDGDLALVACRDADAVEVYSIDASTGLINELEAVIDIPAPVYVSAE